MLAEKPASIQHADLALALLRTFVIVVGHFNFRNPLAEIRAFRVPKMLNGPFLEERTAAFGGA